MEVVGENSKVSGIRRIVRLMGLARKWKRVSRNNSRRIRTTIISPTTDCNKRPQPQPQPQPKPPLRKSPKDVPKGYMGVYAGQRREELRRFIIPTTYLSDPLFKVLLEKAEEEFGFDHNGGLTIPCEIETFKYLLKCMEIHERDQRAAAAANLSMSTAANAA